MAGGLKAALRRRTILASAFVLIGLGAGRAYAQPDIVELSVVNRDTGRVLPIWWKDGRMFVAGEQGERYSLRIANHTDGRVLVVLSVDGVNIISGETANYYGRGYILSPHQTSDIRGWRKSETEIAAFSFTALPNSYAAETGRPGNVGVIGMAVFKEKPAPAITPLGVGPAAPPAPAPPPPPPPPAPSLASPAPSAKAGEGASQAQPPVVTAQRVAPSAPPAAIAPPPPLPIPPVEKPLQSERDAKLGTAHGTLEYSVSHVMPFVRATLNPLLVRQIEYDSYANLVASGVINEYPPHAFPGGAAPGYVPDPPARY